MKKILVTVALYSTAIGLFSQINKQSHGYPIEPVSFTSVKVTDSFWGQRLQASRETTITLAFRKWEETGRDENIKTPERPNDTSKVTG